MKTCFLAVLLVTLFASLHAYSQPPWNVVLIVADDLGYGDVGCYGSPDIRTPYLDQLARQGVRFTNFYSNAPECTPTRTALLTGRYQQRAGGLECAIGLDNVGRYDDAIRLAEMGQLGLPPAYSVIPRAFKQVGYHTAMFGKWHLGDGADYHPNRHGFDLFMGPTGGAVDYFHHTEPKGVFMGIPIDGELDFYRNDQLLDRSGEYLTDLISVEAIKWIKQVQSSGEPFFLYLPFTAPHAPYQASGDWREDQLTTDEWNTGTREAYVDMVESLDSSIGRILDTLEQSHLDDRTLVIFFSDNGPAKLGDAGDLRGNKGQLFEGGIKVPCIARWPGVLPEGGISSQVAITMDFTASLVSLPGNGPDPGRELDGMDILKHLSQGSPDIPRQLSWRKKRGSTTWKATRDGPYKYVVLEDSEKQTRSEYLFNLATDPVEEYDLCATHPERLEALRTQLEQWEEAVQPER